MANVVWGLLLRILQKLTQKTWKTAKKSSPNLMIRTIILNTILSATILVCLFLAKKTFSLNIDGFFFLAPLFYFIIYTVQNMLLNMRNISPSMFVAFYNLSTFLKLALSALFLISYYIFFATNLDNQDKLCFSVFFISLYFIYLIANTIITFLNRNEKK